MITADIGHLANEPLSLELAGPETPFIRNAWYVAAPGAEITRKPLARTLLGQAVMFYRTTAGAVVALQNRCCHRSFPLSQGVLDGDTVICGYHGLRYATDGRCIAIPMQKTVPASLRVRAFPTRERGAFVWIYMGDPARIDDTCFPHQPWMDDPEWDTRYGYLHVKGSYVHLHENLLDLSHLSFLHSNTFGTPEYAQAPVETRISGSDFQVWRRVECLLPPIYAAPLGWQGMRALRSSGSQFVSAGLHVNTGIFTNLDDPRRSDNFQPTVKVAQLITPETHRSTHYWNLLARNFARHDAAIGDFMMQQQLTAFREDVFAIEQITALQQIESGRTFQEVSIRTDKAGVLMRRHLRELAQSERNSH